MKHQLLTPDELAEQLSVNRFTVTRWAREGKIPALKLGRKILRFNLEEVLKRLSRAISKRAKKKKSTSVTNE